MTAIILLNTSLYRPKLKARRTTNNSEPSYQVARAMMSCWISDIDRERASTPRRSLASAMRAARGVRLSPPNRTQPLDRRARVEPEGIRKIQELDQVQPALPPLQGARRTIGMAAGPRRGPASSNQSLAMSNPVSGLRIGIFEFDGQRRARKDGA
jgi:hypothetical protein